MNYPSAAEAVAANLDRINEIAARIESHIARITVALELQARAQTEALEAFAAWAQAMSDENDKLRDPSLGQQLRDWIEDGENGPPPGGLIECTTLQDHNRRFLTPTGAEIQYAATQGANDD